MRSRRIRGSLPYVTFIVVALFREVVSSQTGVSSPSNGGAADGFAPCKHTANEGAVRKEARESRKMPRLRAVAGETRCNDGNWASKGMRRPAQNVTGVDDVDATTQRGESVTMRLWVECSLKE